MLCYTVCRPLRRDCACGLGRRDSSMQAATTLLEPLPPPSESADTSPLPLRPVWHRPPAAKAATDARTYVCEHQKLRRARLQPVECCYTRDRQIHTARAALNPGRPCVPRVAVPCTQQCWLLPSAVRRVPPPRHSHHTSAAAAEAARLPQALCRIALCALLPLLCLRVERLRAPPPPPATSSESSCV
jgi:hypothetical protein